MFWYLLLLCPQLVQWEVLSCTACCWTLMLFIFYTVWSTVGNWEGVLYVCFGSNDFGVLNVGLWLSLWMSCRWVFCWWEHYLYYFLSVSSIFTFLLLFWWFPQLSILYECPVFRMVCACLEVSWLFVLLICVLWILFEMYSHFGLCVVVRGFYIRVYTPAVLDLSVFCGCTHVDYVKCWLCTWLFVNFFIYLVPFPVYVKVKYKTSVLDNQHS